MLPPQARPRRSRRLRGLRAVTLATTLAAGALLATPGLSAQAAPVVGPAV